jgi:hypothetical protein
MSAVMQQSTYSAVLFNVSNAPIFSALRLARIRHESQSSRAATTDLGRGRCMPIVSATMEASGIRGMRFLSNDTGDGIHCS